MTGAETALGEAIIMQLIVAKQPVVALGISPEAAAARYGPYVVAVEDPGSAANALRRGCRAVISAAGTPASSRPRWSPTGR